MGIKVTQLQKYHYLYNQVDLVELHFLNQCRNYVWRINGSVCNNIGNGSILVPKKKCASFCIMKYLLHPILSIFYDFSFL